MTYIQQQRESVFELACPVFICNSGALSQEVGGEGELLVWMIVLANKKRYLPGYKVIAANYLDMKLSGRSEFSLRESKATCSQDAKCN